ncbi:Uu.00g139720.m01.CDS01 [Anthostomella pinea]|uniref:Uu.00g139720.m01.CDS01 n=1 Tax=Anthostomella pinea TaxID=933095 RepID=A0AAI8VQ24_9PEZI|nr:Uu.00g139720.m01.CDS01 [Anthostomella pinea]
MGEDENDNDAVDEKVKAAETECKQQIAELHGLGRELAESERSNSESMLEKWTKSRGTGSEGLTVPGSSAAGSLSTAWRAAAGELKDGKEPTRERVYPPACRLARLRDPGHGLAAEASSLWQISGRGAEAHATFAFLHGQNTVPQHNPTPQMMATGSLGDLCLLRRPSGHQVMYLLKSVKAWVESDGASSGEEVGSMFIDNPVILNSTRRRQLQRAGYSRYGLHACLDDNAPGHFMQLRFAPYRQVENFAGHPQPMFPQQAIPAVEVLGRVNQELTGRDFKPSEELEVVQQVNKKPRKKKVGEDDEEYVDSVQARGLDEKGVTKVMATLMQCKEKWCAIRVVQVHGYQIPKTAHLLLGSRARARTNSSLVDGATQVDGETAEMLPRRIPYDEFYESKSFFPSACGSNSSDSRCRMSHPALDAHVDCHDFDTKNILNLTLVEVYEPLERWVSSRISAHRHPPMLPHPQIEEKRKELQRPLARATNTDQYFHAAAEPSRPPRRVC